MLAFTLLAPPLTLHHAALAERSRPDHIASRSIINNSGVIIMSLINEMCSTFVVVFVNVGLFIASVLSTSDGTVCCMLFYMQCCLFSYALHNLYT